MEATEEVRRLYYAALDKRDRGDADGYDVAREKLFAHFVALESRIRELEAAPQWEANHQRDKLEDLGLADEFPFDCDSIEHVGEALLIARDRIRELEADNLSGGKCSVPGCMSKDGGEGTGLCGKHTNNEIRERLHAGLDLIDEMSPKQ